MISLKAKQTVRILFYLLHDVPRIFGILKGKWAP